MSGAKSGCNIDARDILKLTNIFASHLHQATQLESTQRSRESMRIIGRQRSISGEPRSEIATRLRQYSGHRHLQPTRSVPASNVRGYDHRGAHWCARPAIVFSYGVVLALPAMASAGAARAFYASVDEAISGLTALHAIRSRTVSCAGSPVGTSCREREVCVYPSMQLEYRGITMRCQAECSRRRGRTRCRPASLGCLAARARGGATDGSRCGIIDLTPRKGGCYIARPG